MRKYVSDSENLKLIMNLLLHPAQAIQLEAFNIFKIFVLNPKKPDQVTSILVKNKELIIRLLSNFLPRLADFNHFQEEKSTIMEEINALRST